MTSKTRIAVVTLIAIVALSVAVDAIIFRWREIATQAFVSASGAVVTRYQWRVVKHDTGACIMVLSDEQTGHVAITAVDASVCGVTGDASSEP